MNEELLISILLVALAVMSILLVIFIFLYYDEKASHAKTKGKICAKEFVSSAGVPTAKDAKFLRQQRRNPSWSLVYTAINKAIANGEVKCEIWFRSNDPKISYEELKEELGVLGYTVTQVVRDECFDITWG